MVMRYLMWYLCRLVQMKLRFLVILSVWCSASVLMSVFQRLCSGDIQFVVVEAWRAQSGLGVVCVLGEGLDSEFDRRLPVDYRTFFFCS